MKFLNIYRNTSIIFSSLPFLSRVQVLHLSCDPNPGLRYCLLFMRFSTIEWLSIAVFQREKYWNAFWDSINSSKNMFRITTNVWLKTGFNNSYEMFMEIDSIIHFHQIIYYYYCLVKLNHQSPNSDLSSLGVLTQN